MHGKNKSEVQEKIMKEPPSAVSAWSVRGHVQLRLLLTGESSF